jgi:PKD repeat protein
MSRRFVFDQARVGRALVALAAALALIPVVVNSAEAGIKGGFSVDCLYVTTAFADPIVFPGDTSTPPQSHSHDFFGNQTTNANSTYASMTDPSAPTSCSLADDKAGYWNPSSYLDGREIFPSRVAAYYFGIVDGSVESMPPGLQMIAGNKNAAGPLKNPHAFWFCGASTPSVHHPYDCRPYAGLNRSVDGVIGRVEFPNCWDGTGLGPSDVAYRSSGSCPSGFPHPIPQLSYRVHFGIWDPCAGLTPCTPTNAPSSNIKLTLSSGSSTSVSSNGAFYTLHTDFWNTWNQSKMDQLVADCVNAHVACGKQRTATNQSPVARFSSACTDLTCAFTDASTDPDGRTASWSWDFGDGTAASTLQNPSHTYAAGGTYDVRLTVTDDKGATGAIDHTVTPDQPASITLSASASSVKTKRKVDLTWSGATSANVDIKRNGVLRTTTANDGSYSDRNVKAGTTYSYVVCEAGTTTCSNAATVTL